MVLPTDRGLLDEYGWNPQSDKPVLDISLETKGLPLDADALRRLCGISPNELIGVALGGGEGDREIEESARLDAVEHILEAARTAGPPVSLSENAWHAFIDGLSREVRAPRNEVPRLTPRAMAQRDPGRLDEFDEMSMASTAVDLASHGLSVGELAPQYSPPPGLFR